MPYLKKPFHSWPWNRNFADKKLSEVVPREELNSKFKGFPVAAANVEVKEPDSEILKKFDYGFITNDYNKLIQKTEPLLRWYAKFLAKKQKNILTLTSRELAIRY